MKTISELTSQTRSPMGKIGHEEKVELLGGPIAVGKRTARYATYEHEVFNFLWHNRDALGIKSVHKFTNILVDGEIILSNGRRLLIEIKLRMNWLKACQAEWQFRQFLKRKKEAKNNPVDGAIVFFEEFSGDWSRKANKAAMKLWGWEGWYLFHHDSIDGMPLDLLMLSNNKLQGYPD